jgi:tyrosine-protein kinase
MEQTPLGITTILRSLRRRRGVLVVCAILVPAAALGFSLSQEKQYTASASLLFRDPGFDQKLFGSQVFQPSGDATREAATNIKLVSLDTVAQRTARRLPGVGSVSDKVHVQDEGQANLVGIDATDHSPRRSAQIANTFAQEYIAFRREADRAKISDAQGLVERRLRGLSSAQRDGTQGRSLRGRLEQLQLLSSLQTGNAELAQRAEIPSSPSSPRVVRNTVIGGVLGVVLGMGLALLFDRIDRRLRDPKEIEAMFDRPILGAIPDSPTLERSDSRIVRLRAQEAEAFRMLRANLRYFNVDRRVESVLVTSAAPGDGKTTVAWNLAVTAGSGGGRALLIEADLRHPALAQGLGLHGAPGLSTVLAGEASLHDIVQEIPVPEGANGRAPRTISVLLAGPLPPNPTDLLESDRMRALIADASRSYDLVVIDTPPTSVVSDPIPLVPQVDGVIVVTRLSRTTREAALHLRNQLQNLEAPVLGVVVNAIGSDSETYGYEYGYAAEYGLGNEDERAEGRRRRARV